jgi:iron complex outermembrane receptor protein
MFLKIIHFVMFLFIGGASLFAQITGRITDELGEPLTGAVLFDEEHHTGVSTDGDGNFSMHFPHEHDITLLITYLGYLNDTITVAYSIHPVSLGNIILVENRSVLPEIHILDENSKHETSLNAQNLHQSFFEKNNKGTFATALEKLPGISAINVGVGIAKPVIRGIVFQQDHRQFIRYKTGIPTMGDGSRP